MRTSWKDLNRELTRFCHVNCFILPTDWRGNWRGMKTGEQLAACYVNRGKDGGGLF